MLPKSNQPGQLYGTAKTHKFTNIDEITIDNLKFRPIIAQTGTYTYNAAQVIAKYLKPLCSGNNYIIRNTQEFPMSLKQQDLLSPDEEHVSYDVESLFPNVQVMKLYSTRNLCQRKITEKMFQINHKAFITKINNRKHVNIEPKLLRINSRLRNGWTHICHIFWHLYDQSRRRSC